MKTMLAILLTVTILGCGDDDPLVPRLDEGEKCSVNDQCSPNRCSIAFGACLSTVLNRPEGMACRFDWDCATFRCSAGVCAELLPTGAACVIEANYCSSGHCVKVASGETICS